jgi:tetratricopeptide (TPR) repeat protein
MRLCLVLPAALLIAATAATADVPYTPSEDSAVLERLAVARLPGTASLRELRDAWTAKPDYLPAALAYARAALELNRREEDPRYLGYAEAALARWWQRPQPPPEVMLLRASLRRARVDYDGAESDLRALIESPAPEGHAARITRASLNVSKGEPAAALADCEAATAYVSPLVASTCVAAARGLAGDAAGALADLEQALSTTPGAPLATLLWAHGVAAELAQRLGRTQAARQHFEEALRRMAAANTTDPGLLASYADFLLDQGEPRRVEALLGPYERQDSLLLRLTLAERALALAGDAAAASAADEHARRLALRFQEMRERGDRSHLRERALFELGIRRDAARALQLIRQSWAFLREPVDARLYLRAAIAAKEPTAALPVQDWLRKSGLQDARLTPELAAAQKLATSP